MIHSGNPLDEAPSELARIKLSSLQNFINDRGGNLVFAGLTATDVNDLYLRKPITLDFCSAQIFVSFSWEYHFLDIVATLQRLFGDRPDVIIWMDIFALGRNLHYNLENIISSNKFNHMVFLRSPWNSSAPLKQFFCNSVCKCIFDVAMNPADEEELEHAIMEDCKYAKRLAMLVTEIFKLPTPKLESVWYNPPLFSMDANMFSSLVKGLGDGFEMCSAIIRLRNITGSLLVNFSNEVKLIAKLKELGIHSLFHQKVIARNILIWNNRVCATCIPHVYDMNPNMDGEVLSTIEYSNKASQYPIHGIKLSSLNKFIETIYESDGRSMLEELSVVDVKNLFIKPLIIHKKSSYCEYLKTIDPQSVGEAQVFISHSWKYKFLDVVDILHSHFENTPNMFIWMDIFSKNPFENTFADSDVDDYLWVSMSVIKHVKHVVLILFPWNHILTAWMLYDIVCVVHGEEKCKFDIAMSRANKYKFMKIGADSTLESILPLKDCRNSTTLDSFSKIRILYLMETMVGFKKVNESVINRMMNFSNTLEQNETDIDVTLDLINDLAKLYSNKHEEALHYYTMSLHMKKNKLGPNHPETLQTMNSLAALYVKIRGTDDELSLCNECLAIRQHVLGKNHPDTLQSVSTLASLYAKIGSNDVALELYIECLAKLEEILGKNHPDTFQTMNDLALLYKRMGRDEDSFNVHMRLFSSRRNILGEKHEDTLQSMKTVIESCKSTRRTTEALFLFKNYIAILEEKFGKNHSYTMEACEEMYVIMDTLPLEERICVCDVVKSTVGVNGIYSIAYEKLIEKISTDVRNSDWKNSDKEHYATAMRTLGIVKMNQGMFEVAEDFFGEANELEVEKPMLKLQSMNDLAVLYSKMGKYMESWYLFEKCLTLCKEVLKKDPSDISVLINSSSPINNEAVRVYEALRKSEQKELEHKHPYILTLKSNFALLKMRMGKYAAAWKLLDSCLAGRSEILGGNHPDTLASMNNLAELYDIMGENDKAKVLYKESLRISYRILEERQPFTERMMDNLDSWLKNVSKYRNTLALFTDHLSLREPVLGTEHKHVKALRNLYKNMVDNDKSVLLHTNCFHLDEKTGKSNDIRNLSRESYSIRSIETTDGAVPSNPTEGKSEEDIKMESRSRRSHEDNVSWLAIIEEVMRVKHPGPLAIVNNIAYLYMKLEKYDQALPLFTNCLAMREEVLGKKHPDTLQSIRNLAELFKNMGKYFNAFPLYEKYASLLKDICGEKHPQFLNIKKYIAFLYIKIGEYDKAQHDDSKGGGNPLINNRGGNDGSISNLIQDNPSLFQDNPPSIKESRSMDGDLKNGCFAKLKYGFKYNLSAPDKCLEHTLFVVCSTSKYIVSATDMRILVWQMKNNRIEFQCELRGHTGPIVCLYAVKDKVIKSPNQILSASYDGTIKQWDLDEGLCLQSFEHNDYGVNECLAVICNEKYIFKGVRNQHTLTNEKKLIHVFDIERGNYLYKLEKHKDYILCFAVTSAYLFSGSQDKTIIRWKAHTSEKVECDGPLRHTESVKCAYDSFSLCGHTASIHSLCCTNDESRLISGSDDNTVRIWDIQTGETIQILVTPGSRIRCVCMSEYSKQIICGGEDHTVRTWELETGCPIRVLRGHTDRVTSVCNIPGSDKFLSCSSDMSAILWDVHSSPILYDIPHKKEKVNKCHVLSLCQYSANLLMSCTKDQIYEWDPQQQYNIKSSHVFSDMMGAEIFCICENKTNQSVLICHNDKIRVVSTVIEWICPDKKTKSRDYNGLISCICASSNYTIIGFTQKNAITIKHVDGDRVSEKRFGLKSIPLAVDCLYMDNSSCSSIYIIIGSEIKDIFVWKYDDGNVTKNFVLTGHASPVRCLTHSIDNKDKYIISGSDDNTLKLFRLPVNKVDFNVSAVQCFEGHTRPVSSVLCTTDRIISGSADKTIMIWSFNARNPIRTLIGHTSDVTGLQISLADHLVSVSKDGTMKVWDLSVGDNVPSDVELQDLIQLRNKDYGYCALVTDIIKSMATDNFSSINRSILEDMIDSHQSLSFESKSAALPEANRLWEHSKISSKPKSCNLGGFLNSFQLRVEKGTMDLIPYSAESKEYETIPLVHWMSREPQYRDYLLNNILPTHPEVLYTRTKDGKTLFSEVVQKSGDPNFIYRSLEILSTNLKQNSQEIMWRDHYEISKNDSKDTKLSSSNPIANQKHLNNSTGEEETCPLVDVEDIVQAVQILGRVDIIRDGILSLQLAPDALNNPEDGETNKNIFTYLRGKQASFWDSDSQDKFLVQGCRSLFRVEDLEELCNRHSILQKFLYNIYSFVSKFISSTEDGSESMQVMFVPFPMRIYHRGKYEQHTSSLLLQACIETAIKKDDASVFECSTLSAILTYKLKIFGWSAFRVKCLFCTSLVVHFGYYTFEHSKIDIPIWWPILLFIHSIPVVILEFLPFHLSTVISLNSTGRQKAIYCCIFLAPLLGVLVAILWVSYDQPGSEYDAILNAIFFLIIFSRAVNSLKYLPTYGLFVRMLQQVLERMWSYVLLLIIYFVGFATTFNILIPTVLRAYNQECGDTSDSDECVDMKATTERFQYPVISGVTTYLTMMNSMGWESTAFNISDAYSVYAFIVLVCLFVFISNVALNITIALMNDIYGMISKNEHASCHLVQAQYVLGIERLLLCFGFIRHDIPKHFPRWILVLCPKKHQSVDDRKNQPDDKTYESADDDKGNKTDGKTGA